MKKVSKEATVVLAMEKDNPDNITGMQLKAWKVHNGTEVLVRLFQHDKSGSNSSAKKLWEDKTNGQVCDTILGFLEKKKVIRSIENWEYSTQRTNELRAQDEYEDSDKCIYFSWHVSASLIAKF